MGISPMMQHYLETKQKYPDTILFYRLGDFYEMFFEDAELVSRELELTLTGKDCGLEKRAPMCGVPYHAASVYISKLNEKGYRVAICEQLSDPKAGRGLVERDVVQIITPGTVLDDSTLDKTRNNFLMVVFGSKKTVGVCYSDVSTGLIEATEFSGEDRFDLLNDLMSRISPSEILCNDEIFSADHEFASIRIGMLPDFTLCGEIFDYAKAKKKILSQFEVPDLVSLDIDGKREMIMAIGGTLLYFEETQKRMASNIKRLQISRDERYVHLDYLARKNLELTQNNSAMSKKGSLLWLLDRTKTPMGSRKIRRVIEQPLRDEKLINERLDAVEELASDLILRESLIESLSGFSDIERKCGKISAGTIMPKECLSLADTLSRVPEIKRLLLSCKSKLLREAGENIEELSDIKKVIFDAIDRNCSNNIKDGGFILSSFNDELYKIRNSAEYGKQWLAEYECDQRERTGIKNLKTGYNRVFGYYIEVTKSGLANVPENYIRKQTTINSERFITPELKEMEYRILNSHEQSIELEFKIYGEIKGYLASYIKEISEIANVVATVDFLLSFASVAVSENYVRPKISSDISFIKIEDGRHPVVEAMSEQKDFSPNDTFLDSGDSRTMLITGPNMAGKSTYMRQVAMIALMAHMGCFVPAKSAEICIIDRVFTRVGASDDLASGRSTFMVEMSEVSNIIKNATDKSLILLDEVGRGTSTYDGMSIAAAIIEYLSSHLHAKTLFSTHYHELTNMEGRVDGVKNYRVLVKEWGGGIVFLHKIARGSANRSFGIEVAKLAGLPDELVARAKEVLLERENDKGSRAFDDIPIKVETNANVAEIVNVLKEMDLDTVTPLMAFGTLQNLVDKVKKD